ncbi:MAG: clostripain-related cysteine peptidase [Elusimicrobiales bacterium]
MPLKKLALLLAIASFPACAVAGAVSFDQPGQSLKNAARADSVISAETPAATAAPAKSADDAEKAADWTIMVFVNGKNNLEPYAFTNIYQMERIGSNNKVKVVVEFGRTAKNSSNDGAWKGCRRYLMQKADDTNAISSPVLDQTDKCDMGDYNRAIDFGKWAMAKYPAKHYMYVLWNHGSGWKKASGADKGISYDDETGHHITTPQMGQILKALGHVDVYGSDACLMQMAEVSYEIKDYTEYIVGSEETEPADGYTYDAMLKAINGSDLMPESVAKATVDSYSDHYGSRGSTQSSLKSAALPEFVSLLDSFTAAVISAGDKDSAKAARSAARNFAYADNKDLYDFVTILLKSAKSQEVIGAGKALLGHMDKELIAWNRYTGDYSKAHGLAIYLPSYSIGAGYGDLAFTKDSRWQDFIRWLNGN